MLVSLKHVENAILGVLKVISILHSQAEVLLDIFSDVALHRHPRIPSFVYFYKVIAEFNTLIFIS